MGVNIKVLGPGCKNCEKLLELVKQAVSELGLAADVEYIKEMAEISKYIMLTPGLVINGKVAHQGKPLPKVEKIKTMIESAG